MGEVVRGSRPVQPLLRKYRQPLYDEEKVGNGAATQMLQLFTRRQGEPDLSGWAKTARDTNLLANSSLGARQEFYLVGINIMLDWNLVAVDERAAVAGAATNEKFVIDQLMTNSLFRFQFGRGQPLIEIPMERIPFGMGPCGSIYNNGAAADVSHIILNGLPSVREFFDLRLRKTRPRHIQPEQSFHVEISWPNGAITIGTASGEEWYRIMVYLVGILLSAL